MYYSIAGLCPRTDIDMGRHGFQINLHPKFKKLVALGDLTQERINNLIKTCGNQWLDACGYGRKHTEDMEPLGSQTRRAHEACTSIRVQWGEWGPEHITVPGNTCGLDLDHQCFGNPMRGPGLLPHNIDSWGQVQLLLIAFTTIVDRMTAFAWKEIMPGEV